MKTDKEKIDAYEKRIKYVANYIKENNRRFNFTLRNELDKELIVHIEKQPNINNYLRELVRKDYEEQNKDR